jgi:hypothetical protein
MEMVWHDKFMQQMLFLRTILKEDVEKEAGHSVELKDLLLLECGSGDEVATVSGIAAGEERPWRAPQRLKPLALRHPYRSAEALRHPKAMYMAWVGALLREWL